MINNKILEGLTEEEKVTVMEYAEILYKQDEDPKQLKGTDIESVKDRIFSNNNGRLFTRARLLNDYLWAKRCSKWW